VCYYYRRVIGSVTIPNLRGQVALVYDDTWPSSINSRRALILKRYVMTIKSLIVKDFCCGPQLAGPSDFRAVEAWFSVYWIDGFWSCLNLP
jgi:hypothetical protein